MNDEIKEILDNIKKCCEITKDQSFIVYQRQDILALLDYITNLQEENKILNENNQAMQEEMARTWKIADDYKSKNDKAIEYIENDMPYLEEPDDDYENTHKMKEYDKSILLTILQGSDK